MYLAIVIHLEFLLHNRSTVAAGVVHLGVANRRLVVQLDHAVSRTL